MVALQYYLFLLAERLYINEANVPNVVNFRLLSFILLNGSFMYGSIAKLHLSVIFCLTPNEKFAVIEVEKPSLLWYALEWLLCTSVLPSARNV